MKNLSTLQKAVRGLSVWLVVFGIMPIGNAIPA
jgi:hypothetical protein